MIIEALTFKLALDFAKYLKKNRIYLTDVKLDFFDRSRHEYVDFADVNAMQRFYEEQYVPLDKCALGSIVGIQYFLGESDTYDFQTSYLATDVLSSVKLRPGVSYDRERNPLRDTLRQRQTAFLSKSIAEYVKFYSELKHIYLTGIYSPCYAEPGWSENTWWLKSLREVLASSTDQSSFPYSSARLERNPQ